VKEEVMKAGIGIKTYSAIALALMVGSATSVLAADFGRAGGPVGADRIVKVARTTVISAHSDVDYSKWHGAAGGPVGADAIAHIAQMKVTPAGDVDYSQWYGRAGGPVGIAAVKATEAKVAQAK
jgi:hypothetical protein